MSIKRNLSEFKQDVIKLTQIKHVDDEKTRILMENNIKEARNCENYNGSVEDLAKLEKEITGMAEDKIKYISNIDDFMKQCNLVDGNNLKLNLRTDGRFVRDVKEYLDPLKLVYKFGDFYLDIIGKIWTELCDRNCQEEFVEFIEKENSWIGSCDMNDFIERGKFLFLLPHLNEWRNRVRFGGYNFMMICDVVRAFVEYNITDYSATCKILVVDRNEYAEIINPYFINMYCEIIKSKSDLNRMLKTGKNIIEIFPPFDFKKLFVEDVMSQRMLETMNEAIVETEGGSEWIKNVKSIFDKGQTGDKILHHPKVLECGHTGGSISWTVNMLKNIYTIGWAEFVNNYHRELVSKL